MQLLTDLIILAISSKWCFFDSTRYLYQITFLTYSIQRGQTMKDSSVLLLLLFLEKVAALV